MKIKIKVKVLKPRNLFAFAKITGAGAHRKTNKQLRKLQKQIKIK